MFLRIQERLRVGGELMGDIARVDTQFKQRGLLCVDMYGALFVNISASDSYGGESLVA